MSEDLKLLISLLIVSAISFLQGYYARWLRQVDEEIKKKTSEEFCSEPGCNFHSRTIFNGKSYCDVCAFFILEEIFSADSEECEHCNSDCEVEWKYCPSCGHYRLQTELTK